MRDRCLCRYFFLFFYVSGIPVFYTALFSQLGTPLLCLGSLLFFFLINRIFFFFSSFIGRLSSCIFFFECSLDVCSPLVYTRQSIRFRTLTRQVFLLNFIIAISTIIGNKLKKISISVFSFFFFGSEDIVILLENKKLRFNTFFLFFERRIYFANS